MSWHCWHHSNWSEKWKFVFITNVLLLHTMNLKGLLPQLQGYIPLIWLLHYVYRQKSDVVTFHHPHTHFCPSYFCVISLTTDVLKGSWCRKGLQCDHWIYMYAVNFKWVTQRKSFSHVRDFLLWYGKNLIANKCHSRKNNPISRCT